MILTSKKIEAYLEKTRITLESVKEDEYIKGEATTFGYNDGRLDEGLGMVTELESISEKLSTTRGLQASWKVTIDQKMRDITSRFASLKELLLATFQEDLKLVREMGLEARTERTYTSFLAQATGFYSKAMSKPTILEGIAALGLTPEKLTGELDLLQALHLDVKQYTYYKGDVQRLIEERNLKLKTLKQYMKQLKTVLLMMFKRQSPQVLERVGIFMLNRKRRKTAKVEPPEDPPNPEEPEEPGATELPFPQQEIA